MTEYKNLELVLAPPLVRINLARPPLNVLGMEAMEELARALDEAARLVGARVLVLAATGKAFCAGVDVKDHMGEKAGPMLKIFHGVVKKLWHYDLPTIALVEGAALGGGCEIALSCDFVIASPKASFGQPEIAVGVFPPPAVVLFPRLVGLSVAKDLIMTGRIINAEEAAGLGLVQRVAEEGEIDGVLGKMVDALAAKSLPVLRATREAILSSIGIPLDLALSNVESFYLERLTKIEDSDEGLRAFLEKRKPNWKDR
jgi:cyclohexa-1,5-dienecarbonyl-CoA hydratase